MEEGREGEKKENKKGQPREEGVIKLSLDSEVI